MAFICNECGTKHPKWLGRCSVCQTWDSITEDKQIEDLSALTNTRHWSGQSAEIVDLKNIALKTEQTLWQTGAAEFDNAIGGGIVPGSIGILGGEPGIGKSTLILQLMGRLKNIGKKCIYISGEESADQIKIRADRLLIDQSGILLLIESELEKIMAIIEREKPDFAVFDSIQTLYSSKIDSQAGSIIQIREVSFILTKYTKIKGCAFLLIAHINKEGTIAGPKTIEHMVDYLIYLEGSANQEYRYLRSLKNRFGPLNEVGFFKMTTKGLAEVKNPNRIFMENWKPNNGGSVIFAANEGSRVFFLEVQALVSRHQSNFPSRTTLGIERNRLLILLAALEKHLNLSLSNFDIYLKAASGLKTLDPAVDMAIIAAIYSSFKNIPIKYPLALLGESSLAGDFSQVRNLHERLVQLEEAGIKNCFFATNRPPPTKNAGFLAVNDFKQLAEKMNKISAS